MQVQIQKTTDRYGVETWGAALLDERGIETMRTGDFPSEAKLLHELARLKARKAWGGAIGGRRTRITRRAS